MAIFVGYLFLFFGVNIALMWFLKDAIVVQFIATATMAGAILVQKFLHKKPVRDLGYRLCTWRQALVGLLLPIVILGLILGIGMLLGVIQLGAGAGNNLWSTVITSLALQGVVLTFFEMLPEGLTFRGYILGKLRQWMGDLRGLLFSMTFFPLASMPSRAVSLCNCHCILFTIPCREYVNQ